MKPVLFFDLDGVLADFVRGALAHHGKSLQMADVRWDFPQQVGFGGTWAPEFWEPLGETFWAGLDTLRDGFELLGAAERLVGADRIGLLSSPCDTRGCAEGKRAWVARHMPDYRKRLFLGSAKELFAAPGKVLVDDHDPNCDRFAAWGGRAILVPRPWNARRGECCPAGGFDAAKVAAELLS